MHKNPEILLICFRKSRNDVAMLYPCPKALPPASVRHYFELYIPLDFQIKNDYELGYKI